MRTEEGFRNERQRKRSSDSPEPQLIDKNSPKARLNQTSNFSLAPNARPHELNSFYDTFTKLNDIKTRLTKQDKDSVVSIMKDSKQRSTEVFNTIQPVVHYYKSPVKKGELTLLKHDSETSPQVSPRGSMMKLSKESIL